MSPNPLSACSTELQGALARIQLLVLDVDGVLTDGRVVYVGEEEQQSFCVRDGQGLAWLREEGIALAWITGRGCRATERRAREFGVHLQVRSGPKETRLQALQEQLGIDPEFTLAMGDDLPDLGLAARSKIFCCPADACEQVLEVADFVSSRSGGRGAVREVCELVLAARGNWPVGLGESCG